ncbi:hypothetical protein AB1Y20_006349 [Prymnesium parvum]|uniref:VLRF1 domain-containing protein n=1 Tax=Prymnesium parvum TaxID=97485 RepID=A0AB34J4B1_PRYPA
MQADPAAQRKQSVPLLSLTPDYLASVVLVGIDPRRPPSPPPPPPPPPSDGDTFTCRVSGVSFDSAEALRRHYHTDWYRYNLRRAARGLPPLAEAEVEALLEAEQHDGEELSASGSDASDAEAAEAAEAAEVGEEGGEGGVVRGDGRVALADGAGAVFLVWRPVLLPAGAPLAALPAALRAFCGRPAPLWVVVLCRGGHFAAAACELRGGGGKKRAEEAVAVRAHRCFHRYVTRRKAGGRQSVADGAKSIKSAGSSIRRHNEVMLAKEARELLGSWLPTHLRQATHIWVSAPGPANAAVLFAGADAPLQKTDPRVRSVPFMTARPTLGEATRVAVRLSRVEYLSDEEAAALSAPPATDEPIDTAAAEAEARVAAEALAARQAAAAAAAEAEAEAEAIAAALPRELHEAAAAGDAQRVAELLQDGADPTVPHISFGWQLPYDLSKTKETRNAFRRHLAAHPEQWDWKAAHVPSGLTDEAEAEKEERAKEKAKEKKKRAEKARKERRKAEEEGKGAARVALEAATAEADVDELNNALQVALKLGVAADDPAAEAAAARLAEMRDPEWQRRKEREIRAAAAERRLGGLTPAQERFLRGEPSKPK